MNQTEYLLTEKELHELISSINGSGEEHLTLDDYTPLHGSVSSIFQEKVQAESAYIDLAEKVKALLIWTGICSLVSGTFIGYLIG